MSLAAYMSCVLLEGYVHLNYNRQPITWDEYKVNAPGKCFYQGDTDPYGYHKFLCLDTKTAKSEPVTAKVGDLRPVRWDCQGRVP